MKQVYAVVLGSLTWLFAMQEPSYGGSTSHQAEAIAAPSPESDTKTRADRRCSSPRSGRPAYLVITMTIHDPDWVPGYDRNDVPRVMMEDYGACYIVRSARPERIEGDGDVPSVVAVIEFPSIQEAKRFLNSPEYAPFREARRRAATTHIYAVD